MGLIGGGQGAFIGRVHATAAVLDNRAALVAGALSSDPAKAKASASDYDIPADRAYGSYKEMAEAEKKRPRPGRLRLRRDAQPHALRDRQDLRRGRLQRHLRQAADVRPRAGRRTAEGRREVGRRLRGHAQLHRLPARAAGPRDGPERRARRDQRDPLELHPGLAADAARIERPEAGQVAHRPEAIGHRRVLRRHRHARLQPRPLHHRPFAEGDLLQPEDVRERPGARRLRHRHRPLRERCARHRHRQPDLHGRENDIFIEIDGTKASLEWHQENPNKMFVRKNGEPHKIYTRNGGPYLGAAAGGATPHPERPPGRLSSKRSPTSTPPPTTRWRSGRTRRSSRR